MQINGIDLDGLGDQISPNFVVPSVVPGRIAHIDADFLAYQTTAVAEGDERSFEDMKHNAKVAITTLREMAAAEFAHLHLTPSGSTKGDRYKLAIQREYQGNRKDKPKPQYLNLMRQHLSQAYSGTLHQFCEADDGMSSEQYRMVGSGNTALSIIVSKDKDLSMVPGLHLDWETGEIADTDEFGEIWIDETKSSKKLKGLGQKFFWAQMLMGDTADNIKGLPLVNLDILTKLYPEKKPKSPKPCGPVLAYDLLSRVKTNKQALAATKALYATTPAEFTHWETGQSVKWQDVYVSEAQLLWMRRDPLDNKDVIRWWLSLG